MKCFHETLFLINVLIKVEYTCTWLIRGFLFSWFDCTSSEFIFLFPIWNKNLDKRDKLWTNAANSAKKNRSNKILLSGSWYGNQYLFLVF